MRACMLISDLSVWCAHAGVGQWTLLMVTAVITISLKAVL